MSGVSYDGGNSANYGLHGVRCFFSELIDDTTTPKKYGGFRDIGNVVNTSDSATIEWQKHYTAKSGTRKEDRSGVKSQSEKIALTLDELCVQNIKFLFQGAGITAVAADPAATVTDEVMQLRAGAICVLGEGYSASSIVVKSFDGLTTYVKDTDYTEETVIGGFKGIKFKSGGTLTVDSFVRVNYTYSKRAHALIAPGTKNEIYGKAYLFVVSDNGPEFLRSMAKCQLMPDGEFSPNSEDWTQLKLALNVLDNSDVDASYPFGELRYFGVGENL